MILFIRSQWFSLNQDPQDNQIKKYKQLQREVLEDKHKAPHYNQKIHNLSIMRFLKVMNMK